LSDEVASVVIKRDHLLDNVIDLYSDHTIIEKRLRVEFLGEEGEDLGGLTKDLLTSAWVIIFQKYFRGENIVVPFLPLYLQPTCKAHYIAIGRLLCHTASLLSIIPPRLSRVMIICLIYGNDSIQEELLISDFLLFLLPLERSVVQLALNSFTLLNSRQVSMLTDVFSTLGFMAAPKERDIRDQIVTIARSELVDKPAPLLALMRKGIPPAQFDIFWSLLTIDVISIILKNQMPTGQKVVDILSVGDTILNQQQENAMYYLQQYCLAADHDELAKFLWFVTGSTVQPSKLEVMFTSMHGAARRPIAHTCSNTLEMSDT